MSRIERFKNKRGIKPKTDRFPLQLRLNQKEKAALEQIAQSYNCFFGELPSVAALIRKVAQGELIIVPSPPSIENRKE